MGICADKVEKIYEDSLDSIPSPSPSVKIALLPQVNVPTNNLNFHWRWRWLNRIQAISLNFFYFMYLAILEQHQLHYLQEIQQYLYDHLPQRNEGVSHQIYL